jgi:uncharacterized membrane protein YeaQ/YmgE (transglycosylase-associated protein family)
LNRTAADAIDAQGELDECVAVDKPIFGREDRMSMIIWILLGVGLGLIASRVVSTTGEGTVVDILLGIVGALAGGWLFNLFGGASVSGFDIDNVYGAGVAVIGAIVLLALYHAFLRRRMR